MDTCTFGRTEETRGTSPATTSERLEALRGELARQNDALAQAAAQLSAMGNARSPCRATCSPRWTTHASFACPPSQPARSALKE